MIVSADSNCLTFIIDAMQGISEPIDPLADERQALFRTYLYLAGTLHSTPRSKAECLRIQDPKRLDLHRRFLTANFDVVRPPNSDRVNALADSFRAFHSDEDDCYILAEAIEGGADVLLTYDDRFIARLARMARSTRMLRPTEYWRSLDIPRGSKPDKVPDNSNPLSSESWWRW